MMTVLTWIGIAVCLVHSAMFSGLNLAMFGISRLRLEVEATSGNAAAARILALRRNAHGLLTTILWGNVAVNCLLTVLLDSIMAGLSAWIVSTVGITFFGEITPQAYFCRHSLRVGAALSPVLRFYQVVLLPVAWPTAKLLDLWLGEEGVEYFRERSVRELIKSHILSEEAEIDRVEGIGAINFPTMDDLAVRQEGEPIDPLSVIRLPVAPAAPVSPALDQLGTGGLLEQIKASDKKWIVLTDTADDPRLVLNADAYLRDVVRGHPNRLADHSHRPIVLRDPSIRLGEAIRELRVEPTHAEDDVIDRDLILLWPAEGQRRVITGADLLGRLLRGIVAGAPPAEGKREHPVR